MSSFAVDARALEDQVKDTLLAFAHEHAPLIRKISVSLSPDMSLESATICMFLGTTAELLMTAIGKDRVLELVHKTLDSVHTVNATVAEAAKAGVHVDPLQVFERHLNQKKS